LRENRDINFEDYSVVVAELFKLTDKIQEIFSTNSTT